MRYFIFNSLPKELTLKYKSSVSGGLFSMNLLNTNAFDRAFSILPSDISCYEDKLQFEKFSVVYSKLRSRNKFTLRVATIIEQYRLFKEIKNGSHVWLYNISVLNFVLYILLRLFKRKTKIYSVLADFTPGEKLNPYFLPLINKLDGMISLSNSDLFTINNKKILPGIAPLEFDHPVVEKPIKKMFLISGALRNQIASLPLILDVFKEYPQLELHITGHDGDLNLINSYTNKYKNIIYHGEVSYEDFNQLLNRIPFILSTRDPKYPENQCNFPSKIIEALLHNRIIVSTIQYIQLDGINYFVSSCNRKDFARTLDEISSMSDQELLAYANQSKKTIENFSSDVWAKWFEKIENYNAL